MQEELFKIEPEIKRIPLSDFTGNILGPEANPKQIESFKTKGIIYPIVLEGDGPYSDDEGNICDGRKRIKYCLKNRIKEVVAIVYPKGYGKAAVLNLTLNLQHKSNLPSEIQSVEELMNKGKDEKQIAIDTNLPVATVRKLMAIALLPIELKMGVIDGKIKKTAAQRISKLSPKHQQSLVNTLDSQSSLSLKDVDSVRRVGNQQHEDEIELPFDQTPRNWRDDLVSNLTSVISQMQGSELSEESMPEFICIYNLLNRFTSDINTGVFTPTETRLDMEFDNETNKVVERPVEAG